MRRPALFVACSASLLLALGAPRPSRAAPASPPAHAKLHAPGAKGPVSIDAQSIEGISGLEITARGNVVLKRDDTTIFGEYLKFNQEFGRVEASGGVRLVHDRDRFFGRSLRYDTRNDTGVFRAPHYVIVRQRTAHGSAKLLHFVGANHYRLRDATYTTCGPERPDWQIEARDLDLDYNTGEGRVLDGKLQFYGHTIGVLPYGWFPLTDQRKTGFLTPYYGHSSRRGLEVGLPFYVNIAPEQDLTLTPVYMSHRGVQLKSDYRYLGRSYSGQLRVEYLPKDLVLNEPRYALSLQHEQRITPRLSGRLDLNKVSDNAYFVDLASNVKQSSVGELQRLGILSYSGSAFGSPYSLTTMVQSFQTLQDPLAPIVPPYNRVPEIDLTSTRNDLAGRYDLVLPAQWTRFTHPTLVEGSRFEFNPSLAMPLLRAGYYVTPKLGLHYADYSLDRTTALQPDHQSVSVPWVSLDTGLVFQRGLSWFGRPATQTLEPRLFYVYAPYRKQDQVPLFDTALPDFNFAQIFNENRFVGGDRFGDANELTLAVTSRLLGSRGEELLRATIGQRYYLKRERVTLTPNSPPPDYGSSSLLGSVGGHLFRNWSFDASAQYDPHHRQMVRYGASLRYTPEIAKVLNATYQFDQSQVPEIRQVDLSAQWPVKSGWYALGRLNYSFLNRRLLEGVGGVEYNAGCWVFRGVVQRLQVAAQTSSTAIYFQLQFNGLGSVGTSDVVSFLKNDIPGYAVTNPINPQRVPPGLRPQLPFNQVY